jgi:hypothetical protein
LPTGTAASDVLPIVAERRAMVGSDELRCRLITPMLVSYRRLL